MQNSCEQPSVPVYLYLTYFYVLRSTIFSQERIKEIEFELSEHLTAQRQRLGCSDIKYWGSAKDRYQLEVPEKVISKKGQVSQACCTIGLELARARIALNRHYVAALIAPRSVDTACSRAFCPFKRQNQPADYDLKSKKKGWKRFWTPFITDALERLAGAEQQLAEAQRDQVRT